MHDATPLDAKPLAQGIVQPWDCDVMGHFTVRHYAAAFDDASWQLLFALSGEKPVAEAQIGWADVRQVYEYHAEMRQGELWEITGRPVILGRSSVTVEYLMRLCGSEDRVATMTSTLVRFDRAARKSVAIRGSLRERIEAMLPPSAS